MSSSDRNVLPLTFDDTATTNYGSVAQFTSRVAPKNVNITAGVPSGDVCFELSTGVNTFLDLYKTYISMRYTCTAAANSTVYIPSMLLLRSMFARAVVRLNGKIISQSNNYTADSIVSARLSGGESYNKHNNGFYDIKNITDEEKKEEKDIEEAGDLTSIDRLDALWLRSPEGLVIPPNNKITFEFTIDANYRTKAMFKSTPAAGVGGVISIQDFNIHPTYYVNESESKRFNTLRFCNIKSFLSSVNSNAATLQYTVSPQIMKAVVAHYAPGYATLNDTVGNTPGSSKMQTAYLFNGGTNLSTLQFRLGNISVPVSAYNFSHGYREAYEDYIKDTNQLLKDSAKESYAIWSGTQPAPVRDNWGKIIIGNITKPSEDLQNSLEIQMTYAGNQPQGTMIYVGSVEEQLVMFHESATGFSMEVAK